MFNSLHYNRPTDLLVNDFEKVFNRFLPACSDLKRVSFNESGFHLPNVDIKEDENSYLITADLPGMAKSDIKINMDQCNNLVIEGKKETESKEERKNYLCLERHKGSFFRRITLPITLDPKDITAKYQNGVLEIIVKKSKEIKSKAIPILD